MSDDGKSLRGAHGPRMRNWIGAHQLQDMINANADVDDVEDFVKPQGIDQTLAVHDDLKHGMKETSIIIRDPGVDFEESEDIPNLISVTFINTSKMLEVIAQYGTAYEANFYNEVWALSYLSGMYATQLDFTDFKFSVRWYVTGEDQKAFSIIGDNSKVNTLSRSTNSFKVDDNVQFWKDLELLQDFATHIQFQLNQSTFDNPDVSKEWCVNALLTKMFLIDMKNETLLDMAYALIVWAFCTYGKGTSIEEELIEEYFKAMHNTFIRLEVAEFLHEMDLPSSITTFANDLLGGY